MAALPADITSADARFREKAAIEWLAQRLYWERRLTDVRDQAQSDAAAEVVPLRQAS